MGMKMGRTVCMQNTKKEGTQDSCPAGWKKDVNDKKDDKHDDKKGSDRPSTMDRPSEKDQKKDQK